MRKSLLVAMLVLFSAIISNAQTVIEGHITSDRTLTSDKTYILRGFVRVDSLATLTIQPGTVIYGENATQGTLIVLPGGKIVAEGTKEQPIVFTSEFRKPGAAIEPSYGDWGGIIILGNARVNVAGGRASIEGPGDTYGGNNPEDSSGILKYVRIEYPGIAFSPNNEINGLTFGGVGSKTVIDYVQVSYSGDDSFEWFGGSVNAKHLIAYRGWDDDFDTDFGYNGKLQFLLGVRDPEIADVSGSNGFESDNDGSGSTNSPRTAPLWWNVTLVGPQAEAATQINSNFKRGMHLRRSSQNKVNNALIMGYPTGLLIDGATTISDAIAGTMFVKNSIISGAAKKAIDTAKAPASFNPNDWFTGANGGRIFTANSEVMLEDGFNLDFPNALPKPGSPVLAGGATPPSDGFFDASASFIGAFGSENWTDGWTLFNGSTTDVNDEPAKISGYSLEQNYPNPFNPGTKISFSLARASQVKLAVYNVIGQEVAVLLNTEKPAGNHIVNFNASNLPSGIYLYKLETENISLTRKMALVK